MALFPGWEGFCFFLHKCHCLPQKKKDLPRSIAYDPLHPPHSLAAQIASSTAA